jgi:peptidoglycan/LPS O-acetylase OafA/YrhL
MEPRSVNEPVNSVSGSSTITALTGIRGVAALWVVLFHFHLVSLAAWRAGDRVAPIAYGYLGVDLFFLLSGFIMSHVHGQDFILLRRKVVLTFYGLRLARLYPVHLFVLLGLVVVVAVGPRFGFVPHNQGDFTRASLIANLLLLQALSEKLAGWNGPAWSISCEWFAYLLFPLLAWLVSRIRSRRLVSLCVAAELLLFAIAYACLFDHDIDRNWGLALVRAAFEFSFGALLCEASRTWEMSRVPWGAGVVGVVAAAVLADAPWRDFILILACAGAIMAARHDGNIISRVLALPPVVYLGEVSYSLYMIHMPFQMTAGKLATLALLRYAHSPMAATAVVISTIAGTVATASMLYYLVEAPARRWLRSLLLGSVGGAGPEHGDAAESVAVP